MTISPLRRAFSRIDFALSTSHNNPAVGVERPAVTSRLGGDFQAMTKSTKHHQSQAQKRVWGFLHSAVSHGEAV